MGGGDHYANIRDDLQNRAQLGVNKSNAEVPRLRKRAATHRAAQDRAASPLTKKEELVIARDWLRFLDKHRGAMSR